MQTKKAIEKLRTTALKKRPFKQTQRNKHYPRLLDNDSATQPALFRMLWEQEMAKGDRIYGFFTGEDITDFRDSDRWMSCCMHILPKGKYPFFKFMLRNLRLDHPDFHSLVDQGTKDGQRKSRFPQRAFDDFVSLSNSLKEEYDEYRRDNLLP
jgi:hypothetical protein